MRSLLHWKFVRDKRVRHSAGTHQFDRRVRVVIRPFDCLEAQFLVHRRVQIDIKIRFTWNSNQGVLASYARQLDSEIDRLNGCGCVNHNVHSASARFIHHGFAHPLDVVRRIRAHLLRKFEPVRNLIADKHARRAGDFRNRRAQHPDRPRAHHRNCIAHADVHQFQDMHHHSHWFDDGDLRKRERVRNRIAVRRRYSREFAKQSRSSGRPHEDRTQAVVAPPAQALFTVSAVNGGFERNLLAHSQMVHSLSERDDLAPRLVPQNLRIGSSALTNPAVQIPVHVRTANAYGPQSDCHLAGAGVGRLWHFPFFKFSWSY